MKLKAGVLGAGHLGKIHLRLLQQSEHFELIWFYDPSKENATAVSKEFGYKAFDTIDQLLREVDVVDIVTPTLSHFDCAQQAIARGKHVFIEKPITKTFEEASVLRDMTKEHQVRGQVGHVERFNPIMSFLEDNLSRPQFIEVNRLGPYPPPRDGARPRGTEVSVVLDLMIHDLEIILHLVKDDIKSIHAVGVPVLSPTEDIANTRISFKNGCVANVTASRISMERTRKIRVFQDDSYVSLDYMNQSGHLHRKTATGIETAEVPIEKRQPLVQELDAFVACVRDQSTPLVSGSHGSRALDLAVEICRQIRESPS